MIAVLLIGVLSGLLAAPAQADEPLRVLIVGDSVAHGKVGDYTWRYRLWQEFERQDRPVDFVGPNRDVYGGTERDYADPEFDRDHAARWGGSFDADGNRAAELAETYQPDVLILALGLNDLTWGETPPSHVRDRMREYVDAVRAQVPSVEVVLARAPQHWAVNVPAFNALVDGLAVTTQGATVASLDVGFTLGEDTYDPAHPNDAGERKIARQMASALAELGHLDADLVPEPSLPETEPTSAPVPTPQPPAAVDRDDADEAKQIKVGKPARVTVRKIGKRVRVTWSRVPRAKRYRVVLRGPRKASRITTVRTWTSPRLKPGRYVVRVNAVSGHGAVRKVVKIR